LTYQKQTNSFQFLPFVMDFLRKVALFKGRLLFVEEDDRYD
jgi:hypothetical protein